ncbi:glycoside hydrolase family 88/105 protein [Terriglobus albidus]|uniref:glycoside hydrolase family 88/105 protein n=1 Tax=Terriglobus albidus TaxID=1592106 RepID=UPI0021E07DFA|nr:glycoside hydrolase family 88 protein [Terriglobus albidus]
MKTSSLFRAGVASLALAAVSISAHAQQSPKPTPEMQAIIDKDNGRHFGTSPEDAGPLAKDISPALSPAAIDKVMRKVADRQLKESQPYFDRIWTWSVLYSGFMAASDSLGDPKYRNAMAEMAEKFEYQPRNPDKLPNADDISIAQTYAELYLAGGKKDAKIIAPTIHTLDTVMPLETLRPGDPRIPWWWCDALFMAPPVYVRMYAATGDHKYIDYMNAQWQRTYDLLWDKDERLYARDASYIPKRGPNGKKIFWSRGEGWVMAGLARTLQFLPKDDPRRPFYVQQLKDMAARIAELQDKDGQWHASLLDAEHFPAAETSGASLFVYGMAYGVNEGILDKAKYMPVIKKAWAGLLTNIYADGRLGNIQQTGAEPAYYRPSASYTYGVGGFLMAGSELKRMTKKK